MPEEEKKFVLAHCLDCTMTMPFYDTDEGQRELVDWARQHSEVDSFVEGRKHEILISFKVYERKGK